MRGGMRRGVRGLGIWSEAVGVGGLGLVDGLVPVEVGLRALEEEGIGRFAGKGIGIGGSIGG